MEKFLLNFHEAQKRDLNIFHNALQCSLVRSEPHWPHLIERLQSARFGRALLHFCRVDRTLAVRDGNLRACGVARLIIRQGAAPQKEREHAWMIYS